MLNRWEEALNDKVCALDIDGVLNYYPKPWVDFLNSWLDTGYKNLNQAKDNIPYSKYRDLKYEYRESGYKAKLRAREGAAELTKQLKQKGYTILLLTARPFHKHKGLFKQTTDWLSSKKIEYDGIIFGDNKHVEVMDRVPNLSFMIEDHRYYANLVSRWGYRVFLIENEYNQGLVETSVIRINKLLEVLDYGI